MYNANKPDASELPSTKQLLKSTGIAAVVASALLVVVVLPAEYGVDPTGAGSVLGLTEMGRIKMSLASEGASEGEPSVTKAATTTPEPAVDTPAVPIPQSDSRSPAPVVPKSETSPTVRATPPVEAVFSDETTITLAPDDSYEIKLVMEKGAKATYLWFTDGGKANFDTHGDGPGVKYHGYGKGSAERSEGELVAKFSGNHGWFWRNRTEDDLKITLRTRGDYSDIKVIE